MQNIHDILYACSQQKLSVLGSVADPDPVFSRILIRVTQKDRIRIRNPA